VILAKTMAAMAKEGEAHLILPKLHLNTESMVLEYLNAG
jgi:hypothetical protein